MFSFFLAMLAVAGTYNDDLPPSKYQGNAKPTVVITVDNTNTKDTCGVAKPGWMILACEFETKKGIPIIIMPNPCVYPEANDPDTYTHLMCHEFGHVNGWPADHSTGQ